ncbi:MAG: hypothetical protein CMM46_03630 [Rhodospirillaceae bacterium]|nr:hypothetical protein [Rhodospirillaceae bacterium]
MHSAARFYFEAIAPRIHDDKASRIVDKMPVKHLFAPLIALMRRHPLDFGLSCFQAGFGYGYASDLADTGRAHRVFADIMDRWHALLGSRIHAVRYEKLVSNPADEIARRLEHCGMAFHPDCAAPGEQGGLIKTASVTQVCRPISDRSVGRWKRCEDELAPMIEAMGGMDWIQRHHHAG